VLVNPEFETLAVRGNTRIKGDLQVDGDFALGDDVTVVDTLTVGGAAQFNSTVGATGAVNITNATASSSTTTGALRVTGGVGVQGAINVGAASTFTGNVTINSGNVVMTSGNGIDFSATANSSGVMQSELLDDYEHGTWSPVYEPTSGSFATMTMDIQRATYTKVGRMVCVNAQIRTDNVDTTGASGSIRIAGLPYASGPSRGAAHIGQVQLWGTGAPINGIIQESSTTVLLFKRTAADGNDQALAVADLTTGANADRNLIFLSATYFAA
jgi:hypothetical protein